MTNPTEHERQFAKARNWNTAWRALLAGLLVFMATTAAVIVASAYQPAKYPPEVADCGGDWENCVTPIEVRDRGFEFADVNPAHALRIGAVAGIATGLLWNYRGRRRTLHLIIENRYAKPRADLDDHT